MLYFNSEEIIKNHVEYQVFPLHFFMLTYCGIWCPKTWPIHLKRAHKILFAFSFTAKLVLSIEMFIFAMMSIGTNYFKLMNFFLTYACLSALYKSYKMMRNRNMFRSFLEHYFNCKWTTIVDDEEREIHKENDIKIRDVTLIYFVTLVSFIIVKNLSPFIESGTTINLPVDAWLPYSVEDPRIFWLTFTGQVVAGSFITVVHVSIDTLFIALVLKNDCQISILKYRLRNLLTDLNKRDAGSFLSRKIMASKLIFQCIRHQERIYRFGEDVNNIHQEILIILIVSSLPNICINIYSLSIYKEHINMDYIAMIFLTVSALIQFFVTCWYGNEVTLNSIDIAYAVYEMDWLSLDTTNRKLLVMIMMRALRPIEYTVGRIIPMNLESFLKIIQGSYTAFNLLQRTS